MSDPTLLAELRQLALSHEEVVRTVGRRDKREPFRFPPCSGNRRAFRSPKHARQALRRNSNASFRARVYRCDSCCGWHITSRDKHPGGKRGRL